MYHEEDEDKNSGNVVGVEERGTFFKGDNMGKEQCLMNVKYCRELIVC